MLRLMLLICIHTSAELPYAILTLNCIQKEICRLSGANILQNIHIFLLIRSLMCNYGIPNWFTLSHSNCNIIHIFLNRALRTISIPHLLHSDKGIHEELGVYNNSRRTFYISHYQQLVAAADARNISLATFCAALAPI